MSYDASVLFQLAVTAAACCACADIEHKFKVSARDTDVRILPIMHRRAMSQCVEGTVLASIVDCET